MKRWGESVDLIGPTIFLISDASSYITGTDIYVDGGWTANGGL
jgi:gluconate 5-dehydrogenase